MAKTSVELREERATLVGEARTILNKASDEKRDMTAEEQGTYDRTMDAVDKKMKEIERLERVERAESETQVVEKRTSDPIKLQSGVEVRGADDPSLLKKQKEAYRHWLRTGQLRSELHEDQGRLLNISSEFRDLLLSTDNKGGYMVAPVELTSDLVKTIDNDVFIRRLARVHKLKEAKATGIRKILTRMADANWTTEIAPVTEDTSFTLGRRDLTPYLYSKLAKISIRLLLNSSDIETIVRDELGYAFAITEEKAFMTGDGNNKPLGLFVASANGISTARDFVAGTATDITADGLIDVKFSIKQGYLNSPSAGWIFHRDAVKRIRKLKDNQNQYLWQPGLQAGAPDRILDLQYYMSEYAPNTFTAGLYAGLLGDIRQYHITEVDTVLIQRLTELYAGTSEVGFIGRRFVDGAPILEEAFSRVKLAAA